MTTSSLPFPRPLACTDVDRQLADYLDDEPAAGLAPAERTAVDRHVATCTRCQALVDDLRAVTRTAASLPPLVPPHDLWNGIAARLGPRELSVPTATPAAVAADDAPARVLPFDVHHVRRPAPGHAAPGTGRARSGAPRAPAARGVPWSPRRLAAAAAALVAVTAGTTYRLARGTPAPAGTIADATPNGQAPDGSPRDTQPPNAQSPNGQATGAPRSDVPDPPASAPAARVAAGPARGPDTDHAPAAPPGTGRGGPRPGDLRTVADAAVPDAAVPGAAAYDREIAALRAAVHDRRGDLDSATVAVLVRNLTIIDQAIAQSRAALARDPHSQFLGDQLTRALGQKVDLLRTAALMPRT